MKVTEIWRYPVKTMAGETLQRVHIGALGIEGDRVVHVEDAQERVITSRSHPRFLGQASLTLSWRTRGSDTLPALPAPTGSPGGGMRRCALAMALALATMLTAACGSKPGCDAQTCKNACCAGDVCRTELTDETCSTDGAVCVACDTAASRCAPATRACERFVVIRMSWTAWPGGGSSCTPLSCTADARIFVSAYTALAASPDYAACTKTLVQVADSTHPALWTWSDCVPCTGCGCLPPPGAEAEVCRFVVNGSW